MAEAYEATLKALHLKTGTEPINELIAKKIIGIVQANEHDPKRICARTIKELGIQDLANSQKFCEATYARVAELVLGSTPTPPPGPPRSTPTATAATPAGSQPISRPGAPERLNRAR